MLRARQHVLVGKGLPTLVSVLLFILAFFPTYDEALGLCQNATSCSNYDVTGNGMLFGQFSNGTLLFGSFSNHTLSGETEPLNFARFSNSTNSLGHNSQSLSEIIVIGDLTMQNETPPVDQYLVGPDKLPYHAGHPKTAGTKGGGDLPQGNETSYFEESLAEKKLAGLTISAWIKPDFDNGSSVLTVVSDENSFVLGINNDMPPPHTAFFSVFDGIKWTTVHSSSLIPQQWTHLAASFNGSTIEIYVNGTLEGTSHVDATPFLVSGQLTVQSAQNLTSDGNVTIGAYYERVRSQTSNLFSGDIADLDLYYHALGPEKIEEMFHTPVSLANATHFN